MNYRVLLVSAVLASGLAGVATADMMAVDKGIAVKESDINTPSRGMTMSQVASKFGEPATKVPAIGKPPISRWEYPGFVVYFEHDHVIHSVVSGGASEPADAAPAADAAADAAPAPASDAAWSPSAN
jgi:hypothetical protein